MLNNEAKILVGIIVSTIAIVAVGIFFVSRGQSEVSKKQQAEIVEIDYSKGQKIGSDSAKVKLVEFSDFQCPACAAAQPFVKELTASPSADFQFIYRNYPLPQHKNAKLAANFAQIASENNKFFEIADSLFRTQKEWENLDDPTTFFAGLANDEKLAGDLIKDRVKAEPYKELIQADVTEGLTVGVNSTPTFFLNGKKLQLQSFADLKRLVQDELSK